MVPRLLFAALVFATLASRPVGAAGRRAPAPAVRSLDAGPALRAPAPFAPAPGAPGLGAPAAAPTPPRT